MRSSGLVVAVVVAILSPGVAGAEEASVPASRGGLVAAIGSAVTPASALVSAPTPLTAASLGRVQPVSGLVAAPGVSSGTTSSTTAGAIPSGSAVAASALSNPGVSGSVAGSGGQGGLAEASTSESHGTTAARVRREATGRLVVVERAATEAATLARVTDVVARLRAGRPLETLTTDSTQLEVFVVARWRDRRPAPSRLVTTPEQRLTLATLRRSSGATVSIAGFAPAETKPGRVPELVDWRVLALSTGEKLAPVTATAALPKKSSALSAKASGATDEVEDFRED